LNKLIIFWFLKLIFFINSPFFHQKPKCRLFDIIPSIIYLKVRFSGWPKDIFQWMTQRHLPVDDPKTSSLMRRIYLHGWNIFCQILSIQPYHYWHKISFEEQNFGKLTYMFISTKHIVTPILRMVDIKHGWLPTYFSHLRKCLISLEETFLGKVKICYLFSSSHQGT